MFEIFEELLTKAFSVIYKIDENKEYVYENIELLERSLERAEIILISQEA